MKVKRRISPINLIYLKMDNWIIRLITILAIAQQWRCILCFVSVVSGLPAAAPPHPPPGSTCSSPSSLLLGCHLLPTSQRQRGDENPKHECVKGQLWIRAVSTYHGHKSVKRLQASFISPSSAPRRPRAATKSGEDNKVSSCCLVAVCPQACLRSDSRPPRAC